ncbi:InlB B-repeat-containing protein [Treponema sp.]|uniref:InlB B-repeat-containing protein n=1 Tax=Treponema sp. TaxID=166 RepID=UPI0025E34366|nr:InlB B-repeat-containing protein [Treponema sp.]MBR4323351.1 InlB B-repeat-containing protein [Treponema sp.]
MRRNKILPLVVALSLIFSFFLASCMDLFDNSEVATSFKVTFKANYEGSTDADVVQVYAYGERKALVSNTFNRDEGWQFLGWSGDSNASFPKYLEGELSSFSSDVILYAVWREITGKNSGFNIFLDDEKAENLIGKDYTVDGNKITFSCVVDNVKSYSWFNSAYNDGTEVVYSGKDYAWDTSTVAADKYLIRLLVEYEDGELDDESLIIVLKK